MTKTILWSSVAIAGALMLGYAARQVRAAGAPTVDPLFYAGMLEDGGVPVNGSRTIVIRLWRHETSVAQADLVCSTTRPGTPVANGRFRVSLDPTCPPGIASDPETWLEVEVGGITLGRAKIGAVPYALEATRATSADTAARASAATGALTQQIVPAGMIAMFSGVCPTGWTEFTAMRGRVPRGEPTGSATSLDIGGNDNAVVVAHSHGLTGNVSVVADHQHAVSGNTGAAGAHAHNYSGTTSAVGDHGHEIFLHGAGSGPNQGRWNMDWGTQGVYGSQAAYPGTYGAGFQNFMSIGGAGGHNHGYSGTTDTQGSHGHTVAITSAAAGGHTHSLTGLDTAAAGVAGTGANLPNYREVIFCIKS